MAYSGRVYAYLIRRPHLGSQLDWIEGEFFDAAALFLICATHSAAFALDSGDCVSSPCKGQALQLLTVEEVSGKVYLVEPQRAEQCRMNAKP
ncbi:MAG TPA: Rieske (2Fe-2S) protein [Burkholderiales bacterium]|jgi:nitrite reductase/ring-hydroxylating ferredoxin subunit|nr:Rieske (2Fe-2S) protein [Burkholderiales bacterium]